MAEKTNVTVNNDAVLADNRVILNKVGMSFGAQYFKPKAKGCWPNFEQHRVTVARENNVDLCLNRSPRKYDMWASDVYKLEVGTDPTGSKVIYINKGDENSELALPLDPSLISAGGVTDDAIKKGLCGDPSVFFLDGKKLASVLNIFNASEKKRVDTMIEQLKRVSNAIDQQIAINNKKADKYYKELTNAPTPMAHMEHVDSEDGKQQNTTTIIVEEA